MALITLFIIVYLCIMIKKIRAFIVLLSSRRKKRMLLTSSAGSVAI